VSVEDDGPSDGRPPVSGGGGDGTVGMRERVELYRGRLTTGRSASGGWRVEAEIPYAAVPT
jgi:signal transduction histidine kinase